MSILVVGSVAYDTVETPFGRAGARARRQRLVLRGGGLVLLAREPGGRRGRRLRRGAARGVPRPRRSTSPASSGRDGKTFHWQGRYSQDLNSRDTIGTDLNVFEFFEPKIPQAYRRSELVFLGNIDPVLQREVLAQVERAARRRLRHDELLDHGQARRAARDARARWTCC